MTEYKWHKTAGIPFEFFPYGCSALLLKWEQKIEIGISEEIIDLTRALQHDDRILDLIPAYNSLLIVFRQRIPDVQQMMAEIREVYKNSKGIQDQQKDTKLYTIPVCYDLRFCEDLDHVTSSLKISREELIERHTRPVYHVYMLGFLPGFLYLGGLDESLVLPRKSSPRKKVEKGSVGIAEWQTGIYSMESPGGWNIIGRTPFSFFLPNRKPPVLITAGNKVKFKSISPEEFFDIKEQCLRGDLNIKKFSKPWGQ